MKPLTQTYNLEVASSNTDLTKVSELVYRAVLKPLDGHLPRLDDILARLQSFITNEDMVLILLKYNEDYIGLLAALCTNQHLLTETKKMSYEVNWYVDPEHRKYYPSESMRKAYEKWAKDKGCQTITLGDFNKSLDKYYTRKGYRLMEQVYYKEI